MTTFIRILAGRVNLAVQANAGGGAAETPKAPSLPPASVVTSTVSVPVQPTTSVHSVAAAVNPPEAGSAFGSAMDKAFGSAMDEDDDL